MNSDHLARYYQALTPGERLPLIVAACDHGEAVQEECVAPSAPGNDFRLPNYWGLAGAG